MLFRSAAMLLTTEDTLSRPMPHIYQIDTETGQAKPIVVPEASQQDAVAAVGSNIGSLHDVRVKELRIIAQQQVRQADLTMHHIVSDSRSKLCSH